MSPEIKWKICLAYDELTLLDMLEIDMEELVDLLNDRIEENFDKFLNEIGEDAFDED